jgi:hypothetical protein
MMWGSICTICDSICVCAFHLRANCDQRRNASTKILAQQQSNVITYVHDLFPYTKGQDQSSPYKSLHNSS